MSPLKAVPALLDGGECGVLLANLDWAHNPLGPPETWPPELTTVVSIAMASRQPMLIVWGPEQITLYNDAYAAMCGDRHPNALGKPFHDLWYDIWDEIGPIVKLAYEGISTSMDDIKLIMHRKGYPEETHFAFSYSPVRNKAGEVMGMFCPCNETTAEVAWKKAHQAERNGFYQVFENALGAVAVLDGPEHVFRFVNGDYLALVGQRDVLGKPVREALPEVVGQGFLSLLDDVFRRGEPHVGRSVPVDLKRHSDVPSEKRIVDFLYHPMRDETGSVNAIFVQAIDVTERDAAERRQRLLNLEVGHRMRNQLSLVHSIVQQSLRAAQDVSAAGKILTDRIQVLSRAQDLVVAGVTGGTDVTAIVQDLVAVHDAPDNSQYRCTGPSLVIAPGPALMLSLMLHELSTNAAKYGALSTGQGVVEITWRVETDDQGQDRFVLDWREKGGPPVTQGSRTGTGTRLIKAGLTSDGSSFVDLRFEPSGLHCHVQADLSSLQTER